MRAEIAAAERPADALGGDAGVDSAQVMFVLRAAVAQPEIACAVIRAVVVHRLGRGQDDPMCGDEVRVALVIRSGARGDASPRRAARQAAIAFCTSAGSSLTGRVRTSIRTSSRASCQGLTSLGDDRQRRALVRTQVAVGGPREDRRGCGCARRVPGALDSVDHAVPGGGHKPPTAPPRPPENERPRSGAGDLAGKQSTAGLGPDHPSAPLQRTNATLRHQTRFYPDIWSSDEDGEKLFLWIGIGVDPLSASACPHIGRPKLPMGALKRADSQRLRCETPSAGT